ncbi:MAG: proline dehydrogenase family protein, partial [Planctomycetota bacterium]
MAIDSAELERLTRLYGEELFARIDVRSPILFTPTWWDERLMDWSMRDEAVKLQLFRFIDALPHLRRPEDVSRHLKEYFAEATGHISPLVSQLVRWLPSRGLGAKFLSAMAFRSSGQLARRFIAGADLNDILRAITAQRKRKLAFTIDLLGEASLTEVEADRYQDEYLRLVAGLADAARDWPVIDTIDRDPYGSLARVNVSIKLSSLFSQFDPIDPQGTSLAVKARLRPILELARQKQVFVNLDMEQAAFKDLTIRIFQEILEEDAFRDWSDVGIAIQVYLRSAESDVHGLAEWAKRRGAPVWIRLIKGAYWDYETVVAAQEGWPAPVFTRKSQTDANYEKLSLYLLENHRLLRPAFGSHNIRSLAHAMAAAQLMGLPPRSYELQLLYGMADPVQDALVRLDQRVRVYTPFGQLLPGMAYLVRRLLENTANTSFLRASFNEHVPEEKLLMNPALLDERDLDQDAAHTASKSDEFRNEPLTDFSIDGNRTLMLAALADVKKQLGRDYP